MKAKIDKTFCDVLDRDVSLFVHGTGIDNALVSHQSAIPGVKNRIALFEMMSDVIGIEDGHLRGSSQTGFSHHPNVHP